MRDVDVLVIGQGIAGSCLAYFLLAAGLKVLVVDDDWQTSSTVIAAGILDPITGKRFAKCQHVETYLPFAVRFYKTLESLFDTRLFFEKQMLRFFNTAEEQRKYHNKRRLPDYDPYWGDDISAVQFQDWVHAPLGGIAIAQAGYLLTQVFLRKMRQYLMDRQAFTPAVFQYDALDILKDPDGVCWQDIRARYCVFCEGFKVMGNPFFQSFPAQFAKGDILTLRLPFLPQDYILNHGKWLVPIGDGCFRFGATYEWDRFDMVPSETALTALRRDFERFVVCPADFKWEDALLDHQSGVRPTTKTAQPMLGFHDQYPQLGIFNGLGSKGVLQAPYLAAGFATLF